ncbi:MAG TPA: hypothetical protein VK918_04675 [Pyrinomonadaceae bacterium]|nr:hypothetical protein [Pyrinomonadaceae bacterium]
MEQTFDQTPTTSVTHVVDMHRGAEWFFWIAALSVINSLVVTFFSQTENMLFGLGGTRLIDEMFRANSLAPVSVSGLAFSLAIAGVFIYIGYLAWRGSDKAFIVGMFLYVIDAMIVLGFKDFFAFGFHLVALFFLFKGLLASRRRYDPSV